LRVLLKREDSLAKEERLFRESSLLRVLLSESLAEEERLFRESSLLRVLLQRKDSKESHLQSLKDSESTTFLSRDHRESV